MGVMDNEKTFEDEYTYFQRNNVLNVLENIKKNFGSGYFAETKEEALSILSDLLDEFEKELGIVKQIGIGDSLSVHQICAMDYLYEQQEKGRFEIINPFERLEDGRFSVFKDQPNEWIPKEIYDRLNKENWEKARRALLSDVFITGANAVTYDGKIVSTDGTGNRISAVIFGPYKVIMVIGRNKIVKDVYAAFDRVKNVAAPINHYRHYAKHRIKGEEAEKNYGIYKFANLPCVKNGKCIECGASLCTRHASLILERGTGGTVFRNRIHVILVNEDLGC